MAQTPITKLHASTFSRVTKKIVFLKKKRQFDIYIYVCVCVCDICDTTDEPEHKNGEGCLLRPTPSTQTYVKPKRKPSLHIRDQELQWHHKNKVHVHVRDFMLNHIESRAPGDTSSLISVSLQISGTHSPMKTLIASSSTRFRSSAHPSHSTEVPNS